MEVLKEYFEDLAKYDITKSIAITAGTIAAFCSLIIMACLSIYVGAFRSLSNLQKIRSLEEEIETMTLKDAALFPLILSCFLVGLHISLKFSTAFYNSLPSHISSFLSLCLTGTNILHLARLLKPLVLRLLPQDFQVEHSLIFKRASELQIDLHFDTSDVIALGIASAFAGIYFLKKNWILSNIFAIAVAVNDIEFWHLNNVVNGCVLLGGLFVYDIFWVFATDVMLNVARSIEAPVILKFPTDIVNSWNNGSDFNILGLGDVIVPGIFIALLLRFDESSNRGQKLYFYSSLIAYVFGLIITTVICSVFRRGQPAMLYLVPVCIIIPGTIALLKGDINALLEYCDYPDES